MSLISKAFALDSILASGCPLVWRNNLHGAARSRQGCRNDSSRVPKISSGGYLHRLLIARTF
jgi:hypothetical protein